MAIDFETARTWPSTMPELLSAPETIGETEAAPAKVNLFLHVTGRRDDGYHLLDSLVVFADVGDMIRVAADEGLWLELAGRFEAGLRQVPDNLVMRAARLLAAQHGVPARARVLLVKNLPVASGVGGGSADAAAALRALLRLWNLPGVDPLLAARLGADVPVCLAGRPARMAGIGEVLAPSPVIPACGIALINPGRHVSTPAVFQARRGEFSPPARLPEAWDGLAAMVEDLKRLNNDLEPPAIGLCPDIAEVLAVLRATPGCRLARMSGSGATCFGLFADAAAAAAAAATLRRPDWWCWGGDLLA